MIIYTVDQFDGAAISIVLVNMKSCSQSFHDNLISNSINPNND